LQINLATGEPAEFKTFGQPSSSLSDEVSSAVSGESEALSQAVLGKSLRRGVRQAPRCSTKAVKRRTRSLSFLSIDRSEQLIHGTRGRRAEHLVEVNGLR
jgi:hypothetical protein